MRWKIARAMLEAERQAERNGQDGATGDETIDFILDALMSPSANMIDEGIDADENSFDGLTQVATIFTAMIQAAKEGK